MDQVCSTEKARSIQLSGFFSLNHMVQLQQGRMNTSWSEKMRER